MLRSLHNPGCSRLISRSPSTLGDFIATPFLPAPDRFLGGEVLLIFTGLPPKNHVRGWLGRRVPLKLHSDIGFEMGPREAVFHTRSTSTPTSVYN